MKLAPLLPYLFIVAGLSSTLALFVTLKREIYRHIHRQKTRIEEMLTRLDEADRVPQEAFAAGVPAAARAGMNLSKRVHAMRMLRRGEDVSHVAAALGVPRREVELLIRVQSMGGARAAQAGSDQG